MLLKYLSKGIKLDFIVGKIITAGQSDLKSVTAFFIFSLTFCIRQYWPLTHCFSASVFSGIFQKCELFKGNLCDIGNWLTFPSFSWNNDIFPLWCARLTPQEILSPGHFHLFPGLKINDPCSPWALHKSQSNLLRGACGKHLQWK